MEDAHAAILDLQVENGGKDFQAASPDKRLSYFGVYDGHGGDKVALFAGENIHKIIAKQEAFKSGDFEQALKDGFLATDRAILNGRVFCVTGSNIPSDVTSRPQIRRGSIWVYCIRWSDIKVGDLRGMIDLSRGT